MQEAMIRKTVWALMKADSEEEIDRLVREWHREALQDPELGAVRIARQIKARDFTAAQAKLEKRFGRFHPRHKNAIDVLVVAAQSLRLLRLRAAQFELDEARSRNARGVSF